MKEFTTFIIMQMSMLIGHLIAYYCIEIPCSAILTTHILITFGYFIGRIAPRN